MILRNKKFLQLKTEITFYFDWCVCVCGQKRRAASCSNPLNIRLFMMQQTRKYQLYPLPKCFGLESWRGDWVS